MIITWRQLVGETERKKFLTVSVGIGAAIVGHDQILFALLCKIYIKVLTIERKKEYARENMNNHNPTIPTNM